MAKLMLFQAEARAALGRGVEKLTKTIEGTLGPKGGNTIIDRPVGTPIISRDGVSIIHEIELEDLFENMGAQVAREVSMQTNEDVGDGTTTALVLANAMIQTGFRAIENNANPIDLSDGMEQAIDLLIENLKKMAQPVTDDATVEAVARISASEPKIGRLVAQAIKQVGPEGFITVEYGQLGETKLDIDEGASFDRGFLSNHMVTDAERLEAHLENPLILISDLRVKTPEQVSRLHQIAVDADRPLLIIAEEVSEHAIATILSKMRAGGPRIVTVHPPEYGKWRKAMLEDLAILTGGHFLAREFGNGIEVATLEDMGSAKKARINSNFTSIIGGEGDPAAIQGRREHIQLQMDLVEVMVEKDKLETRLAQLSGGTVEIQAGGVTPAERMRREQLIVDSLNAARAAIEDGVVPGGGTALVQSAPVLDNLIQSLNGSAKIGAEIVREAIKTPLRRIAYNCGAADPDGVVDQVANSPAGTGFNGWNGQLTDMMSAGIIDPVRAPCSALKNAGSIAALILTTQALVTDKPEWDDPTYGAARGGGAENLEMSA